MRKINWQKYNKELVRRGEIWVSKELIGKIKEKEDDEKEKRGRPYKYPTFLILFLLIIKIIFRLGYRQLEGFARYIFGRLGMMLCPINHAKLLITNSL